MADPTTAGGGTEGLRAGLAESLLHRFDLRRWQADAQAAALLAHGPLADFLARASAEQARVEAENARLRESYRITDIMAETGFDHIMRAGEERDELKARVASLTAERDRVEAENAGLRAVLRAVLPPKILGEGQERRGSEEFHMMVTWDALKRARTALREPQPTPEHPDAL